MWKSIVLCVSLFGGAALGLALGARFVEASALPAASAIGLCLIGVVLILAAPTNEPDALTENNVTTLQSATRVPSEPIEIGEPLAAATPIVSNRTPTMPFEALNG